MKISLIKILALGFISNNLFSCAKKATFQGSPAASREPYVDSFPYGKKDDSANTVVDYLFVIDNSSSMEKIIHKVREGIKSLVAKPDVFSGDSRIGVISTMIGQSKTQGGDLSQINSHVKSYQGIQYEPGFLSLANHAAYLKFISQASERYANKWSIPLCENGWFKPEEKHSNGHSCFEAATQSSASSLMAEAGIKAFEQFLDKNSGAPIFRSGAIVNVIFISDTHDPGVSVNPELLEARLNFAQFLEKIKQSNSVIDLKFHAISRFDNSNCAGEKFYEGSYFKLVDQSGGEKGDVCLLDDYSEIIKKMIVAGKTVRPIFVLKNPATEILSVSINSTNTTDYEFNSDNNSISIPSLNPNESVNVSIVYK